MPARTAVEVAVVIVNYRSAALTAKAVASLREERRRFADELSLSVVVVENDSGDEATLRSTLAPDQDESLRLVVSPRNVGFGAGNNLGVRVLRDSGARPKYLHFLNPDTEVRPGAIASLVRFLEATPNAGMCGGRFETPDGSPWPYAFRFPSALGELETGLRFGPASRLLRNYVVHRNMSPDRARPVDWLSGASMMVRAELFEQLDGFDERFFLYFEEVDLCRRIAAKGFECWYVPESCVMHILGQSTGVTDPDAPLQPLPNYWFESRQRYFEKHHGVAYCTLADALFLAGNAIGTAKERLRGRQSAPGMSRGIFRTSPLSPARAMKALLREL